MWSIVNLAIIPQTSLVPLHYVFFYFLYIPISRYYLIWIIIIILFSIIIWGLARSLYVPINSYLILFICLFVSYATVFLSIVFTTYQVYKLLLILGHYLENFSGCIHFTFYGYIHFLSTYVGAEFVDHVVDVFLSSPKLLVKLYIILILIIKVWEFQFFTICLKFCMV